MGYWICIWSSTYNPYNTCRKINASTFPKHVPYIMSDDCLLYVFRFSDFWYVSGNGPGVVLLFVFVSSSLFFRAPCLWALLLSLGATFVLECYLRPWALPLSLGASLLLGATFLSLGATLALGSFVLGCCLCPWVLPSSLGATFCPWVLHAGPPAG